MQTCYNCGKQVSDETLICPECGALVKRYTSPARSPEQDAPGSAGANGAAASGNGRYAPIFDDTPNRAGYTPPRQGRSADDSGDPDYSAPWDEPSNTQETYDTYRYSAPVGAEPSFRPAPNAYSQRPIRGSVWRDRYGVHMKGGLTAWFIICVIASAFLATSMFSMQLVVQNQELYYDMLSEIMGDAEIVHDTLDMIVRTAPLLLLAGIGETLTVAAGIWLLVSKRRAAWISFLAAKTLTAAALCMSLVPYGVICAIALLVSLLWPMGSRKNFK